MPRFPLLCAALAGAAAVGLSAAAEAPKPTTSPKLERKNFVEKTASVQVEVMEDPATKKKTETRTPRSARFEMVYVPGGEFTMGSPPTEPGRETDAGPIKAKEGPQHKVRVGNFWMGKCEVTWDEYDTFWYDSKFPTGYQQKDLKLGPDAITRPTNTYIDDGTYSHGREGHPVISMTHHAAMMYCNWLREKTGKAYRLPTEAEWEYAARGGKGDTAYFFGADADQLGEYAWFKGNSKDEENFPDKPKGCTHKVGTRKPNPFGLYDLYGNVWEWTLDQYDPAAYEKFAKNPLSIRPVTVPTAEKWSHVVRGGSWADTADRCRSAARRVSDPSWMEHDPQVPRSIWWLTRLDVIGFRVVLAEDEQPELVGLKPKVVKKAE